MHSINSHGSIGSSSNSAIGFIGIGAMGFAMATNLHAKGYRVMARDVRESANDRALAVGIPVFNSARAVAEQADLVILVVVDAAQIDDVLFAADGVVHAAKRPGAVMLCSTIAPEDSIRIADRLAGFGMLAIDAPISGGPARAAAGTMSMMIAGAPSAIEPWEPVLQDLAAKRFRVGDRIGDAAKAKLVNNLLAGIHLVAGAEALALAEKIGLDPKMMFDIVVASSGASWVFEDRMARALKDDFTPLAAARILTKDVTLATALAASVGHGTPLGDAALAKFQETLARGWAELDDAAVIKTYRG